MYKCLPAQAPKVLIYHNSSSISIGLKETKEQQNAGHGQTLCYSRQVGSWSSQELYSRCDPFGLVTQRLLLLLLLQGALRDKPKGDREQSRLDVTLQCRWRLEQVFSDILDDESARWLTFDSMKTGTSSMNLSKYILRIKPCDPLSRLKHEEAILINCMEVKSIFVCNPQKTVLHLHTSMAYHRGQNSKLRFDIVLSVFFLILRLDIQVFISYESFSYSICFFFAIKLPSFKC